jgi:hypothetical protein
MSDTDSPSSETPEWVGKPESTGAPSRTRKKTSEESGSGGDDEEVPVRKHAKRKALSKEPKKPKPTVVRLLQQNGEERSPSTNPCSYLLQRARLEQANWRVAEEGPNP